MDKDSPLSKKVQLEQEKAFKQIQKFLKSAKRDQRTGVPSSSGLTKSSIKNTGPLTKKNAAEAYGQSMPGVGSAAIGGVSGIIGGAARGGMGMLMPGPIGRANEFLKAKSLQKRAYKRNNKERAKMQTWINDAQNDKKNPWRANAMNKLIKAFQSNYNGSKKEMSSSFLDTLIASGVTTKEELDALLETIDKGKADPETLSASMSEAMGNAGIETNPSGGFLGGLLSSSSDDIEPTGSSVDEPSKPKKSNDVAESNTNEGVLEKLQDINDKLETTNENKIETVIDVLGFINHDISDINKGVSSIQTLLKANKLADREGMLEKARRVGGFAVDKIKGAGKGIAKLGPQLGIGSLIATALGLYTVFWDDIVSYMADSGMGSVETQLERLNKANEEYVQFLKDERIEKEKINANWKAAGADRDEDELNSNLLAAGADTRAISGGLADATNLSNNEIIFQAEQAKSHLDSVLAASKATNEQELAQLHAFRDMNWFDKTLSALNFTDPDDLTRTPEEMRADDARVKKALENYEEASALAEGLVLQPNGSISTLTTSQIDQSIASNASNSSSTSGGNNTTVVDASSTSHNNSTTNVSPVSVGQTEPSALQLQAASRGL
tara:strand:+ start:1509 stop:3344 length:1836 start_codon:yes stop_codon:yes gene_type:complete